MHEEIKKFGCYHSAMSAIASILLSKRGKTKIWKIKILPFVLYRYETWFLTLREESWVKVLGAILGSEVWRVEEGYKKSYDN